MNEEDTASARMGLWLSVRCRGETGRQHLKRCMLEGDKKRCRGKGRRAGRRRLDWWVLSEEVLLQLRSE